MIVVDASVWVSRLVPQDVHRLRMPLVTWDREQIERASGLIAVRTPERDAIFPV